jgi:hypothetical protein
LTLFTNLGAVLKLADWARVLVDHWKEWTHAFWVWAFGWLGIHLPSEWTPVLSFLLFGSLLTIGQAVKFKSITKNQTNADKYQGRSLRFKSWRVVLVCLFSILAMAGSLAMVDSLAFTGNWPHRIIAIGWLLAPQVIIVLFARHRLHAASSVFLILVFFVIIALRPLTDIEDVKNYFFLLCALLAWILPLILLSVAPAKAISRRLIFLALGLLLTYRPQRTLQARP